jgi:hypothetical protein
MSKRKRERLATVLGQLPIKERYLFSSEIIAEWLHA